MQMMHSLDWLVDLQSVVIMDNVLFTADRAIDRDGRADPFSVHSKLCSFRTIFPSFFLYETVPLADMTRRKGVEELKGYVMAWFSSWYTNFKILDYTIASLDRLWHSCRQTCSVAKIMPEVNCLIVISTGQLIESETFSYIMPAVKLPLI